MADLTEAQYERLLTFRTGLRRFLHWSEQQAKAVGLTAAQHQLLLAIRGHEDARGPTIGDVADSLLLRHHSAVGLVDRAEKSGLVTRHVDGEDQRGVRLPPPALGARRLRGLSEIHHEELARLAPRLGALWADL